VCAANYYNAGSDAWNHWVGDVSALKNANMRVRFGFAIKDEQFYAMSNWNLDDIALVSGADCYY